MEAWLEQELRIRFPSHVFRCNSRLFGAEFDFYFPELCLAVEINGVHHYRAIHGASKLRCIQMCDAKKIALCSERGITLHVVDISSVQNFSPALGSPYLKSIVSIIERASPEGVEPSTLELKIPCSAVELRARAVSEAHVSGDR